MRIFCRLRGSRPLRAASLGLPRTQPKEVTVVDAKAHKVVGTIDVGTGPRPGTISPDGRRLYMNVDDLMGFLVIDTAARKVIGKATYSLRRTSRP